MVGACIVNLKLISVARIALVCGAGLLFLAANLQALPGESESAFAAIQERAERGNADAQFQLALLYADGDGCSQNYSSARQWFAAAADQGLAAAQWKLGKSFASGEGGPQSYAQARYWYELAGQQGLAQAQNDLANLYSIGLGGPQHHAEARAWFLKAAHQGIANSQYNLGVMYFSGQGGSQDYGLAFAWLSAAATQGREDASTAKDVVADRLDATMLAEAQEHANRVHKSYVEPFL